jgi:hypothetical protein
VTSREEKRVIELFEAIVVLLETLLDRTPEPYYRPTTEIVVRPN